MSITKVRLFSCNPVANSFLPAAGKLKKSGIFALTTGRQRKELLNARQGDTSNALLTKDIRNNYAGI